MKKIILPLLIFFFVSKKTEAQYVPIAATGYSLDAIAENTTALSTTSGPLDGSNYILYSQAYGSLIGTIYGVPNTGVLSTATKTFQLQNYTGPNVLFIPSNTQDSLTFVTPTACESISLLNFATEGAIVADVTVRFMDNSTEVFSGLNMNDWFNTTAPAFATGLDRASRATGASGGNGSAGNPRLFTNDITLSCVNQNKKVKRIIIKNTMTTTPRICLFAVSAVTTQISVNASVVQSGFCNNPPVTATLGVIPNGTVTTAWLPSGNFGGSNATTITVTPTVTTQYTVQTANAQTSTGCFLSQIITVTVNPSPVLQQTLNPNVLCFGKTATISVAGANTYTWSNPVSNASQITVNPALTTIYSYSGTNQYGCVSSREVTVTVNTNSLSITANTTICLGTSLTLMAQGVQSYTWSTGNHFSTALVSPATTTTYVASGMDIYNCLLSNSVTVTVNPKPTVNITADKTEVCKGGSIQLTAAGATTYSWSNTKTDATITVGLPVDVVYSYTVVGKDANGCSNQAVITVTGLSCAGIKGNSQSDAIRIYPNPANNAFTLETNTNLEKKIELLDLSGRVVLSQVSNDQQLMIAIDALSTGVYYLKLTTGQNSEVIKVVKTN